ncbi:acetolactate synthase catalytic subunit [Amylibacter sp. SFDW26]|uniref:acetolactate synthase catalytic subunit n=1 Tax=Amylibacter sp. SFDW26 TaxID=2652722 RepID=UPI0012624EAB|nr:acetolactate synthase catalytic subunit [Amylibacter sp. SFDW26]KAB7613387.1 acetolactate synthase catalytic subunit [Amylibacter sp. SFDW26]
MPKPKIQTVAQRIAQLLEAYGVTEMFSQSLPSAVVLACEDTGIRQITYRTENAAGTMADAYARTSSRIGVVCAQNGPAATLLVPPLAEAQKVSVPVLAIVQDVPRNQTDKNAFQELDHLTLFASCTKWARIANDPNRIDDYVRQAITAATTGRPGPVALMLPADVLLEKIEVRDIDVSGAFGTWPLDRSVAAPDLIEKAATLIAQASAPLIIAGGGVHCSNAAGDLAELQEAASLPVGTTMMGKGSVDERHPLSLGIIGNVMGSNSTGKHLKHLIDNADVILLVGTRTNQNGTDSWSLYPETAKIIHVDVDGTEVGRNYSALRLIGDAKLTLEALNLAIASKDLGKRNQGRHRVVEDIEAARGQRNQEASDVVTSDQSPIRPERILSEVEKVMTSDTTLVADASYSSVWINSYLPSLKPGMRFITPRGLAGLGWGFPMALGAKLADPTKTVICFAGDGGFGHVWSELETAVRENIPVIMLVLNNGTLGYQKDAEDVKFGRHTGACYFNPVDHAQIAKACGCDAYTVSDPSDLHKTLKAAIQSEHPVLIDIITDPTAYPPLTMMETTLEEVRLSKVS